MKFNSISNWKPNQKWSILNKIERYIKWKSISKSKIKQNQNWNKSNLRYINNEIKLKYQSN